MSAPPSTATIESFAASDGYRSQYRRYEPQGPPRGTLVCLHGIQSHGGWYEYSSQKLCDAGFRVFYLDRRGSGLNEQSRGDTPSFRRLFEDVAEFLKSPGVAGREEKRTTPIYLMGVSWGGKLAVGLQRWQAEQTAAAADMKVSNLVDGNILLCPGFFPQVGLSLPQILGLFGTRMVSPHRYVSIPLNDPEMFTKSPRWREFIRTDPLALHQATARFLVESALLDRFLRRAPKHVTVPTLLLLAGKDRIIRNGKTHRFFQKFATLDKNVITYAEAHHTLEFEPDPDRFLAEILRWLNRRCPQ